MVPDEQVLNKRTLFNCINKFKLTENGMPHTSQSRETLPAIIEGRNG